MNGLQSAIAETLHSFSGTPESRSGTGDERVSGIKSGRVALVTGASRWLGVALAQGLASDGWVVAVNYRSDHAGAARTVEAISAAGGRGAPVRFDVTDEVEVARGMAEISDVLGPLDLIVNNATGPQPLMPVME
jgi:3-oxoacyl-[acyl-carrier protein] reductase